MAIGQKMGSVKNARKAVKKSSSGGAGYITRIPSSDDGGITVRFLNEPGDFFGYQRYYDELNQAYVPMEEDEKAPNNYRVQKRYVACVVDIADDKVKVLDVPTSLFKSLINKYDKYETLLDRDYELERIGEGLDTDYDITPDAPSKKNLKKYDLIDLGEWLEAAREYALGNAEDDDDDDDDDAPRKPASRKGGAPKGRARAAKPEPEEEDEDETMSAVDIKKHGRLADKENTTSQAALTELAEGLELDPDDFSTWAELADAIIAANEGGEEDEDEPEDEPEEEDEDTSLDPKVLKATGRKADKGDEDAQESLTSMATDYELDPDDFETWVELVDAIIEADSNAEGDEEGEEAEGGDDDESEELEVDIDALPDMEISELREIAAALDIPTARVPKAKLVKAIIDAMEE